MMTDTQPRNEMSIQDQYGRLVSYSLPCPNISPSAFLAYAKGQPRFYWESHQDDIAIVGLGKAVELYSWSGNRFDTIQQQAEELFANAVLLNDNESLSSPRLFGGFAFRNDFTPDNTWWNFSPAHFVLPHFQLVHQAGETWLTINANIPIGEAVAEIAADLEAALQLKIEDIYAFQPRHAEYDSKLEHVQYPLSYEMWEQHIVNATGRMKRGELNKVVLSRIAEVQFDRPVPIDSALAYLTQKYRDTYRFLFEARPAHAFYGATPELLVQTNDKQVNTMALAGSIARGKTDAEDEQLAQELLDSSKDRYEHQLVIDRIRERLQPFMSALHIGETGILRLSNIQHIHTPISGTLRSNIGILPVLRELHPTPALGGDPQDKALQFMSEIERVPRGWYGAPIGWIDNKLNGQFGVAIRSAVAQDRRVWMYAGAGIVQASEPQKEWDETALKFRPMLNALGIDESTIG